jgi:peptidoglycan/xylan/chitin deacetylase (PgdA/CDA1 family)
MDWFPILMYHRIVSEKCPIPDDDNLRRSKEFLERVSGSAVDYYAPPGGRIGRRGLAAAKILARRVLGEAGYRRLRAAGLGS